MLIGLGSQGIGSNTPSTGTGVPIGYLALKYNNGAGAYPVMLYKDANGAYRPLAYKRTA